jgi:preprotein translocase subunit SecA
MIGEDKKMGISNRIFGTYSEREVKRLIPIVDKIDAMDETVKKLTNEELKEKTTEFKNRIKKGENLDSILPEAFAVVREASFRTIGLKHYREQLIGGIVLHQGRIAEMKTGEGKTLVATLPAYLNALTGDGVYVVTVNDYLAKRDRELMGQIHEFLGLTVGVIVHGLEQQERQEAYGADITYGTNTEFGFDYLRDNMVIYAEQLVQRKLNYAIVDEVDSILIDEARTPLIISGEGETPAELYTVADFFVRGLDKEIDYSIDEKVQAVILSETGVKKAEEFFKVENYADTSNMELQHHIIQALKANVLMKKEKDYLVKDGEVIIVDEFTGRTMEGRRFSDGLHEAIEAKERVEIQRESKTLATITYQNYFRMFNKLSGMTGTALTEEDEFREIYGLDVVVIPTHKPIARTDYPDFVYKTEKAKFMAVVEEIISTYKIGQPVLVGTVSVEKSEILSQLLKKRRIPHQILNAKHHEKEAQVVAKAGEIGSVTISTNMAGRGTDIKLGEGVAELGGLKIIGTERHESRRIDNQLRGRAGRQGDPGSSRFYISLEDDLMRIFGSERLKNIVEKLGIDANEAIESKMVSSAIENAQKRVEANNFDTRKTLIGYDDVINKQREVIYKQRSAVLQGEDIKEEIQEMIKSTLASAVDCHIEYKDENIEEGIKKLVQYLEDLCIPQGELETEELSKLPDGEIKERVIQLAVKLYKEKEEKYGIEAMREIERVVLLRFVDSKWMDHIDNMYELKKGMSFRSFKQQDPVQAYQFEGSEMFDEMVNNIKLDTVKYLFHINIEKSKS